MSATKEAFYALEEIWAMEEYVQDDLEDKTDESIKFHLWAVDQRKDAFCTEFKIDKAGLAEFLDWYLNVKCSSDDLLDNYNENRFDIAAAMFNYYRQAYKFQAVA
mgnify:CR=1 FL=1